MKKLDRLILRSFLGPLLLTFSIAVFVLLMQFVWKYIDDMVGKGLPFDVLARLLFYAAVTCVPMAMPVSVLFASIMTMGNFGEKYELVAMKAGGVSVRRVMWPMTLVVVLLTGVAFYFSNNVLPVAMMKYKTILFDVTRKKPALNIKPSVYYTDIEGYVIRADEKDPSTGILRDIIIYDHSQRNSQSTVVVADSGQMQTSPDDRYLVFTLYHGHTYTEETDGVNYQTRPFTQIDFSQQVLTFDISNFAFNQSNDDFFKGNYQMMNIQQLKENIARLEQNQEGHYHEARMTLQSRMRGARMVLPLLYSKKDTLSQEPTPPQTLDPIPSAENNMPLRAEEIDDFAPALVKDPTPNKHMTQRHKNARTTEREAPPRMDTLPVFSMQALNRLPEDRRNRIISKAHENMAAAEREIHMYNDMLHADSEYINRHYIEWHRKYTLSLACLVLFLIGAPFGSIVRKGGLGLPLVSSVLFFVIYYIIGMTAEKSVRESVLGIEGMWVSTFVMLPIGLLLTLYATADGALTLPRLSNKKHRKHK